MLNKQYNKSFERNLKIRVNVTENNFFFFSVHETEKHKIHKTWKLTSHQFINKPIKLRNTPPHPFTKNSNCRPKNLHCDSSPKKRKQRKKRTLMPKVHPLPRQWCAAWQVPCVCPGKTWRPWGTASSAPSCPSWGCAPRMSAVSPTEPPCGCLVTSNTIITGNNHHHCRYHRHHTSIVLLLFVFCHCHNHNSASASSLKWPWVIITTVNHHQRQHNTCLSTNKTRHLKKDKNSKKQKQTPQRSHPQWKLLALANPLH